MSTESHLNPVHTGNYALAMCAAGPAVENMLRAFILRRGRTEFESRHNVLLLAKEICCHLKQAQSEPGPSPSLWVHVCLWVYVSGAGRSGPVAVGLGTAPWREGGLCVASGGGGGSKSASFAAPSGCARRSSSPVWRQKVASGGGHRPAKGPRSMPSQKASGFDGA
jgi:hypothetical protein